MVDSVGRGGTDVIPDIAREDHQRYLYNIYRELRMIRAILTEKHDAEDIVADVLTDIEGT